MNRAKQERIAVCRLCGVGDAVQMTPLLRQMRADRPDAEIVCFVSANAAPVLAGAPWIDRLIPLGASETHAGARNPGLLRLWLRVRREGPFDALFCLGMTWRHLVLSRLARARARAGFVTRGWKPLRLFTHPYEVPADAALDRKHESLKYLELWEQVTGHHDRGLGYDLEHFGRDSLREGLKPSAPYVCVAPGAGNPFVRMDNKKWPPAHFARLMELALEEGYEVVALGAAGDMPEGMMPAGAHDLLGKTSLEQAAGLIRRARGFIGNDSGLFHIALGLGTPAAAVFGPTDAAKTGPFRNPRALVLEAGLDCAPCLAASCRLLAEPAQPPQTTAPCMAGLAPELTWQRVRAMLHDSEAAPVAAV